MGDTFNIGELVKELRINKETVRYYEKVGLLNTPVKNGNGYRLYTLEDMRRIRFIRVLKNYGFSLREIKLLLIKLYEDIHCEDRDGIKSIVETKIAEINLKISELTENIDLLIKVNNNLLSSNNLYCDGLSVYNHQITG